MMACFSQASGHDGAFSCPPSLVGRLSCAIPAYLIRSASPHWRLRVHAASGGCVTNKPAIETLTGGVAGDEAEVPATAASLVDPAAAATKTGSAQSANPGGAAQQMAGRAGQAPAPSPARAMVGGDGSSVVMEGNRAEGHVQQHLLGRTAGSRHCAGASGPAGGSLFRSQPQPMPPAQAAPLPLTPQAAPVSLPVQQPAAPQVGDAAAGARR